MNVKAVKMIWTGAKGFKETVHYRVGMGVIEKDREGKKQQLTLSTIEVTES